MRIKFRTDDNIPEETITFALFQDDDDNNRRMSHRDKLKNRKLSRKNKNQNADDEPTDTDTDVLDEK